MRLAESRSEEVRIAHARLAGAAAQVSRAKSERWPQIAGSASYTRTLASEFEGVFEPLPGMEGMEIDLPFGRENTYRVDLSATQNVFTGGRISGNIDLAEAQRGEAEISLDQARAQAVLMVTEAYYDAVLSRDLFRIAEATLAQAERTLAQTKLSFEQGAVPEFDVLRAAVTRDNQRSLVVQRESEHKLALFRLIQLLDLPSKGSIALTSDLDQPATQKITAAARHIAGVPEDTGQPRAPIRRAAEQVRARRASLDVAQAQRWPSIRIGANYGVVNYPADLFPDFDEWRDNFTVGLSLEIPIFTGGLITSEIRAAEAQVAEAEIQLERTAELSDYAATQIREQVAVAHALWKASTRTVDQARRAYEIAELRYSQGVSTQLELIASRVDLEEAQANGARAARDLLVARVRLALLPRLPLDMEATVPDEPAPTISPAPTTTPAPATSIERRFPAIGAQPGETRF